MKYIITLVLFFVVYSLSFGQKDKAWSQSIKEFQKELNREYRTTGETPLRGENFDRFKAHPFFRINPKYRVEALLVKSHSAEKLILPTSSGKSKSFTEYGVVTFTLNNSTQTLTLYTNDALEAKPEYSQHVFLPFQDATNNEETYGGGRYLDLEKTDGDTIIIDFNKAYQPYCAYNATDYSCPLVPEKNRLAIPIKAGVKYQDVYHH